MNKELRSIVFSNAHKMTREMCNKYKDINYKYQFSLCLKACYEDMRDGGKNMNKENMNKENMIIVRYQHMFKNNKTIIGTCKWYGEEYFFAANGNHILPVVYGSKDVAVNMALKEKIIEIFPDMYSKIDEFDKNAVEFEYDLSKISEGVFVYTLDGILFKGYWRNRAFTWNTAHEEYPRTCSFDTLIKDLDRPGKRSFRSMKGAGKKIEGEIDFVKSLCSGHRFMSINGLELGSMEVKKEPVNNVPNVEEVVKQAKNNIPNKGGDKAVVVNEGVGDSDKTKAVVTEEKAKKRRNMADKLRRKMGAQ